MLIGYARVSTDDQNLNCKMMLYRKSAELEKMNRFFFGRELSGGVQIDCSKA